MHTFGVSPDEAYTKATTEAIVSMQKDLMGKDLELFREQVQKNIAKSGKEELDAFIRALNGKYVRAGTGNDPIRNPGALPTGKNFFCFRSETDSFQNDLSVGRAIGRGADRTV